MKDKDVVKILNLHGTIGSRRIPSNTVLDWFGHDLRDQKQKNSNFSEGALRYVRVRREVVLISLLKDI